MAVDLHTDAYIRSEVLPETPIGGGEGYEPADRLTRADADVVAETGRELAEALDGRRDGVVWVPRNARVDVAGRTMDVRGETVIASDRGLDGSEGGLIFTNEKGANTHAWSAGGKTGVFHFYDQSAMIGLRYHGPHLDVWDNPEHPGYIPYPSQDTYAKRKAQVYSPNRIRGAKVYSGGVEIGNVELRGFGQQGVYVGDRNTHAGSPHFHHLHGADCMMTSAGYVIDVARGHPIIEDSYFNGARHVICGFGYSDGGYTVRNCLFGPSHSSHILDMHRVGNNMSGSSDPSNREYEWRAGGDITVIGCTFVETHIPNDVNFGGGNMTQILSVRGLPAGTVTVERCHIPHRNATDAINQTVPSGAITDDRGFVGVETYDNEYGMGEHYPGRGCETNLEDPLDGRPLIPTERRLSYGHGIGTISRIAEGE